MANRNVSAARALVQRVAELLEGLDESDQITLQRQGVLDNDVDVAPHNEGQTDIQNGSVQIRGVPTAVNAANTSSSEVSTMASPLPADRQGHPNNSSLVARHSSNVIQEMRRQFSPYNMTPRGSSRRRPTGSSVDRSAATCNLSFFCLGNSSEVTVPTTSRKLHLQEHGLGKADITIRREATSADLEAVLRQHYPKLRGSFVLMKPLASVGQGKPLVQCWTGEPIPTPEKLARYRAAAIYIRPLNNLLRIAQASATVTSASASELTSPPAALDVIPPQPSSVLYNAFRNQFEAGRFRVATTTEVGANNRFWSAPLSNPFQLQAGTASVTENANTATDDGQSDVVYLNNQISENELSITQHVGRENSIIDSETMASLQQVGANSNRPTVPLHDASNEMQESSVTSGRSSSGGFNFHPSTSGYPPVIENLSTKFSDCCTIAEFREKVFLESGGGFQELLMSRENFGEELFGIYKGGFNFKKKTHVKFLGEPGRDINALSREFFSLGINQLKSTSIFENHPLFEGEEDHRLPTCNPILLATRQYEFLGTFMGHSALQTGIGFVGMSKAAVRHIFSTDREFDNDPIVFEIQDVPDDDARSVISKMQLFIDQGICSADDRQFIKGALSEVNIFLPMTRSNVHLILQQYFVCKVLSVRCQAFEAIKKGLKTSGTFEFLQQRSYLWDIIFPSTASMRYTGEDVISKIKFDDESSDAFADLKEALYFFIRGREEHELKSLVQAWTGWSYLPVSGDDNLNVSVIQGGNFVIHACFNTIDIPSNFTSEEIESSLMRAIEYGSLGFGSV